MRTTLQKTIAVFLTFALAFSCVAVALGTTHTRAYASDESTTTQDIPTDGILVVLEESEDASLLLSTAESAADAGTSLLSCASNEDISLLSAVANEDILLLSSDTSTDAQTSTENISLLSELAEENLTVTDVFETADGNTVLTAEPTDGTSAQKAAVAASELEGVAYAQPNYVYELLEDETVITDKQNNISTPFTTSTISEGIEELARIAGAVDDPYSSISNSSATYNQYWLYSTNLEDAWRFSRTNNSVTIACLDTGATVTHEDLSANILTDLAWDACEQTSLNTTGTGQGDNYGHGSAIAGIAAGVANNALGIAGASYNANILPVCIATGDDASDPLITTASVMNGLNYLIGLIRSGTIDDLRVINMSFGQYFDADRNPESPWLGDELMHAAIKTLRNDYDIAIVCAGGNKGISDTIYPADYDECISVTALNTDGTNWVKSDYNAAKDISAPGVNVLSVQAGTTSSYSKRSGTSVATPMISGTLALLFAAEPNATVSEACEAIYETATPINDPTNDRSSTSGSHGALDAGAALEYLMAQNAPSFTDVETQEWYADAVSYISAHNIMSGYEGTTLFGPNDSMTRAMAAQVLYNYLSNGEVVPACTKSDVDQSAWYADAINWCVYTGAMTGYDSSNAFGVNDPLTREQVASMFAKISDANCSSTLPGSRWNRLVDTDEVSPWAVSENCVVWAVENELLSGWPNGDGTYTLDPLGQVTRAQMAQIMENALENDLI